MALVTFLKRLFGSSEPTPPVSQRPVPVPQADPRKKLIRLLQPLRDACGSEDRARIEAAIAGLTTLAELPEVKEELLAANIALQLIECRRRLAAGEDLAVVDQLSSGEPCYFKTRSVSRDEDYGPLTITQKGILFEGDKQLLVQWPRVATIEVNARNLIVHRTTSDTGYEFYFRSDSEAKLAHLVGLTLWKRVSAETDRKPARARKAKTGDTASPRNDAAPSAPAEIVGTTIEFPNSGHFAVAVVGESRRQSTLRALAGDRLKQEEFVIFTAAVVPEPTNSFDSNAVAIYIHRGGHVGYLTREDAVEYKPVCEALIAQKAIGLCRARLIGGTTNKPSIGVMLDLAEPATLLDTIAPTDSPF